MQIPDLFQPLFTKNLLDLTLASIYQKKYDQGDQFIRKSYESLLIAWTTLHPLAHTSRLAKLADLERVEC